MLRTPPLGAAKIAKRFLQGDKTINNDLACQIDRPKAVTPKGWKRRSRFRGSSEDGRACEAGKAFKNQEQRLP